MAFTLCHIGTVGDVAPSMHVNLLSGVLLAAAASLTSAEAATISATGSPTATIFSRDASAQFGRNGYAVGMDRTDDGTSGSQASAPSNAASSLPVAPAAVVAASPGGVAQADAAVASPQTLQTLLQSTQSDSGTNGLSIGGSGGGGSQGSTTVGTVPLPSSLPLFGAALLIVVAFGRRRRKAIA